MAAMYDERNKADINVPVRRVVGFQVAAPAPPPSAHPHFGGEISDENMRKLSVVANDTDVLDDYSMRVSKASSRGSDDIEAEEGESGEEEDALSDGDIEDSDDELGMTAYGNTPDGRPTHPIDSSPIDVITEGLSQGTSPASTINSTMSGQEAVNNRKAPKMTASTDDDTLG
eukprot:CAMPEP_0119497742 /NCGR_PEP_ID=MMETSP1344-20130328/20702_1 /TAXON_ID=236787 /ORGANISM="Florenciella parvula, Strain CCMP2471" /LENGTH=171 /DNA_ID=CAMNT_0007533555 /DNA_START=132 /DNA_END=643 /DNA_ORIENTATION=-